MKNFFESIASLFEELLFFPFKLLTHVELFNWWVSNGISFIFLLVGLIAGIYWINQLRKFDKSGEEKRIPLPIHFYRSKPISFLKLIPSKLIFFDLTIRLFQGRFVPFSI